MDLFDYDAELRLHQAHFFAAAKVGRGDRVLDIGCGTGQTTREAARAAVDGSALGVDISEVMLDRARRISADEGPSNVGFELADAQVHPFAPAAFDLCISRFGVMFFADPLAAFTNIARAIRPGGRLAWLVWQGHDRNEWATVFSDVLAASIATPGRGPFSLADPVASESLLVAAGFTDIHFTEIDEPVYYGPDSASAYDNLLRLTGFTAFLAAREPVKAEQACARLRAVLTDHETETGVYFDSRSWLISARCP
ncbi:class I SAM-dependent methyltransferase [Nocardia alba]|uniref:Methyltransferase family protein n=1 Tax=Nocardia alba TaxID=225051 RepID=A0A4R1FHL6_9NOCA|nr:methyltransferase family protein [Nocardia alba]